MERVLPGQRELLQAGAPVLSSPPPSTQDLSPRGWAPRWGDFQPQPTQLPSGWHQPCQGRGTPGWPRIMQRTHPAHQDRATRTCELPAPPGCSSGALTPRAWRGTFWSQTGGSPAGFYLFYYFSLNICCQTSYRSKLLHSTTSHLLFRIGRIRRVEVKSKHRRAGKAPRCIA